MHRGPALPRRRFVRRAGTTFPPSGFDWSKQRKAGTVTFANWPLYVDTRKVDGKVTHPTLEAFTEETGIRVEYREVIEDSASFFGKLRPQLAAGRPTGFDLIVMGYPRWLPLMIPRGNLVPLDHSHLRNLEAHVAPKYEEAPYDPATGGRSRTSPASRGSGTPSR